MLRRLTVPAAALLVAAVTAAPAPAAERARTYQLDGVRTVIDRAAVAASGAAIVEVDHALVVDRDAARDPLPDPPRLPRAPAAAGPQARRATAQELPDRRLRLPQLRRDDRGDRQRRGRLPLARQRPRASAPPTRAATLCAVKISDNVGTDENEPEVLFNAHQHAREHLTVEMALYLLNLLTDELRHRLRGSPTSSTRREIWIVLDLNPDGGEYDIATGSLPLLAQEPPAQQRLVARRHRPQPQLGLPAGAAAAARQRHARRRRPTAAPSAFSAPETAGAARLRRQPAWSAACSRSRRNIDFHTYGELVLWPYGYTTANTATGMTADDHDAFATLGQQMAAHQRLHPGAVERPLHHRRRRSIDWLWGTHKIFAYTFEMYPATRPAAAASTRPTR